MQYINTTFPHPDHVLHNKGTSGWSAAAFKYIIRFQPEPDLVIMEHAVNLWKKEAVLDLMSRVMRRKKNPAVLMVNHHIWQNFTNARNKPTWPGSFKEAKALWGSPSASTIEEEAAGIAREFGVGSISVFHALRPLLLGATWPPPRPLHRPFQNQFREDGVHYNLFMTMQIYTADLMIEWLRTANYKQELLSSHRVDVVPSKTKVGDAVVIFDWAAGAQASLVMGKN